MRKVLVTDGQQRKALAATRSLGQRGDRVLVADESRLSLTRFSRFCAKGLLSPPAEKTARYWPWLKETVSREAVDVLLPMDDETTGMVTGREKELSAHALVPTPEQFSVCRDKLRTIGLARRAGVPHPETIEVQDAQQAEVALAKLGGRAVLRARFSAGGRGIFFIDGTASLLGAFSHLKPEWGGVFLQERLPLGRKFDVCLLFDRQGSLKASFVQEEKRWFPLEQGASTLQESVHRPDLVQLARQLLAPIGWQGPVEVEFMEDEGGQPRLMEVNPRFWNSLSLAIRCGVDFPDLTAGLAMGEKVHGPPDYPYGIRCRWLLPGDLLHFAASSGRWRMDPPIFSLGDDRTFDDIVSPDDLGPAVGFGLAVFRYMWSPKVWRMVLRWP